MVCILALAAKSTNTACKGVSFSKKNLLAGLVDVAATRADLVGVLTERIAGGGSLFGENVIVAELRKIFLLESGGSANRALLTVGIAARGAGGSCSGNNYLGVGELVDVFLLEKSGVADRAVFAVGLTARGTGSGIAGDGALNVAWEARMHNGHLYYIAVTNQPTGGK